MSKQSKQSPVASGQSPAILHSSIAEQTIDTSTARKFAESLTPDEMRHAAVSLRSGHGDVETFEEAREDIAGLLEYAADLRTAAADYALLVSGFCAGVLRWEAGTRELCVGGLRYQSPVDKFGVPGVHNLLRGELRKALGKSEVSA